jgi:hypothetical protein
MVEKIQRPIAYNQDYTIGAQLIGKPSSQAVFKYFWDMYCTKLRYKQSPYTKVNISRLSDLRRMNEKTVVSSIEHLKHIGLISIDDDDMCLVNGGRYVGLVRAFNNLEDGPTVKKFIQAVDNHDDVTLDKLGFAGECVISEELDELKGAPIGFDSEDAQNSVKIPTTKQNYRLDRIFTDNPALLPTTLYNYVEVCKNTELSVELQDELQKCVQEITKTLGELRSIVASESNPVFLLSSLQNYRASRYFYRVDDPKSGIFTEQKSNNINKNKINEPMLPASDNKGVKESDNLNKEVVDAIPSEGIKRMYMGNYSQKKLKSQLPFYTSQEIQEILNNPQEAITSNDKLFIRTLWNVAKEQASVDQDNQEVEVDVEGYKFPADRFQRDILSPALEEANEIIETGMLRTEAENLPVELEELQPEQVELILDWEGGKDSVGQFIVGSASRFRKIYSEPVEKPKRRRGRNSRNTDEREKAKEYFRNLLRCDDDDYDRLSQIEKAVFNFANEFLEVDWVSGEVIGLADSEDLKEKFISPARYTSFLAMLREEVGLDITEEDFESVLNQAEPQPTGILDHIGETMFSIFSYEKIQTWIKKHTS